MSDVKQYDAWLTADDGPAALVIREHLAPVEGADGVLFPATFAAGDNFPGGYNIDEFPGGKNVCLIDTVGSQANRIEPMFAKEKYASLVPQIVIRAGEKKINLLQAGHRAGDAIVRCSLLRDALQKAFKAVLMGNAEPLAKIAPTSLVFGVWDSRDTQARLPRLIASTIRAFDVQKLTRHAVFVPAVDYVAEGMLEEPQDLRDAEGKAKGKHPFAQRGFVHIPVSKLENTQGGVMARGGIRRDATLSLAALRLLTAGNEEKRTVALRRYVLGLALVAFTDRPSSYLRQGCSLVVDPEKPREFVEVYGDGRRVPAKVTHEAALGYAKAAAQAFGVGESRTVEFDRERAKKDLQTNPKKEKKERASKGAKAEE